jgi:hypothetical protein
MSTAGAWVLPASAWRQRFVESLLRLSPQLNPDAADEVSDSQFITYSKLPPELAAAEYVSTERARRLI